MSDPDIRNGAPPGTKASSKGASKGAQRTALACLALVVAMTGLAFASVPLYDLFCKATGYEGTPRAGSAPDGSTAVGPRLAPMTVHFDTNVAPGLPWRFQAETRSVTVVPGEVKTVFFKVRNTGTQPTTGIATFNVLPGLMGSYFVKVQCFCFEEQTLQPGESMEFPLAFYIDGKLRQDEDIADLTDTTLSYTYFASKKGGSPGSAEAASKPRDRENF